MLVQISNFDNMWFILLFISIYATSIFEMRWSEISIEDWWRNKQFWVIGGTSVHLFAVFQCLMKVLTGIDIIFTNPSKVSDEDDDFAELYVFKWTTLLISPATILMFNIVRIVASISNAINIGHQSWGPFFFAILVIVHLYPFLKGQLYPFVIVWSILLTSVFLLLVVCSNPSIVFS